jgi:hypothetical protein
MSLEDSAGLPVPCPRPDAIEAGVFGWDVSGPLWPDATEVEALTEEHAWELLSVLSDIRWLTACRDNGCDPATGSPPKTVAAAERVKNAADDLRTLQAHFDAMLSVYADAFGSDAAGELDRFVQNQLTDCRAIQKRLF